MAAHDRLPAAEETLPVETSPSSSPRTSTSCLALVVLWSAHEPWHAGEVAFLPAARPSWTLGRRDRSPDASAPPLAFLRIRGGTAAAAEPLADPHLSRRHLQLTAHGAETLQVENLGRVPLVVNGVPSEKAVVRTGDVLEIDRRLLLLVVHRTWPLAEPQEEIPLRPFPFGGADEDGFVGESEAVWALRRRVRRAARAPGHVLLLGASGTGKELAARAVHAHSRRGERPLVARNAATFPESLVDAELFGNAKNFPNVGMLDRPGLVGAADGSTLFLDEIGELPLHVQPHLLRVMDRGEYQRLGDATARHADIRVVGATNRPRATLRSDLSARFLHEVALPDLNDRREDLPLLVRHVLLRLARESGEARARELLVDGPDGPEPRLSPKFVRQLLSVTWETNVRELEAFVWRALDASEPGEPLAAVPERGSVKGGEEGADDAASGPSPDADRIQICLDRHNGVLEEAWRELGLSSRYALRRLIAKHGVVVRRQPARRT
ncbi:MAG TPA: sigma 54-interacting transcriptional regulator [Polyangiaceae bacterium]|jgi:two-component system nitrogen regulation response regulator GlnG/two-component system response regulator HydG